jgi:hypothetical protein
MNDLDTQNLLSLMASTNAPGSGGRVDDDTASRILTNILAAGYQISPPVQQEAN